VRAKLLTKENKKLKTNMPLNIKQVATTINQNIVCEKTAKISTWCCQDQGSVYVRANFAKDFYTPEEHACVRVDVNNS